jgi:hypothetical protein
MNGATFRLAYPQSTAPGGAGIAITKSSSGVVVRGWDMAFFGIGSALSSSSAPVEQESVLLHPTAPIPVQGPPVGRNIRVALGETGL